MFLNRTPKQCPAGKIPNTEADWDAFSAMANFLPGTNMEQAKTNFLNQCNFEMCPPGSMMCNGVCVGVGAPTAENPDPFKCPDVEKVISTNTGISPMLILAAAAAAFFFAG